MYFICILFQSIARVCQKLNGSSHRHLDQIKLNRRILPAIYYIIDESNRFNPISFEYCIGFLNMHFNSFIKIFCYLFRFDSPVKTQFETLQNNNGMENGIFVLFRNVATILGG